MDLKQWLSDLGLSSYAQAFEDNDIDVDILQDLTADDLREMGVTSVGHRRKLLRAIEALARPAVPQASTGAAPSATEQGERRHLTVMFVDLVGSTALSTRFDPEDWRGFISTYQTCVAEVVRQFDGYVAKFLGDGLLCYFGWPQAHEDDAERSVRAGLAIVEAVRALSLPNNDTPASRIGIATGLVVIGDLIGGGNEQLSDVYGQTPNLAARLQGVAEPDQIVLPMATKDLLGDVFDLRSIGAQSLKGIAEPVQAYVVDGENITESRFAALRVGALSPIVGREQELAAFEAAWSRAQTGLGGMLLLVGEAGIGKSRIVQAAVDRVAGTEHLKIIYQCSPYHTDSAFHPIIQNMIITAGIKPRDNNAERLAKLEAMGSVNSDNIGLFAPLLGVDATEVYGTLDLTPAQLRARTMQALIERMGDQAAQHTMLIICEDLHWLDPTTQELLDLALDSVAVKRVLLLATARPGYQHDFGNHPVVEKLHLARLGQSDISDIISKIAVGKSMPSDVVRLIGQRTDGVPLFVEELTKSILESDVLKDTGDAFVLDGPLDGSLIPNTLQDSLMARLDRMNTVKEVAQVAACIGREFRFGLLSRVSRLSEPELIRALDQLVQAELVHGHGTPPEADYLFKHALVRDTAYESLLKGNRRAIHKDILDALAHDNTAQPELRATHAEAAGLEDRAIELWEDAGTAAVARPAFDEGIAHFGRALALLAPRIEANDTDAMRRALPLLMKQGVALMALKGWGNDDTKARFERALALDERLGGTPLRLTLLYGLMTTHIPRGEPREAVERGPAFVALAEEAEDVTPAVVANRSFAITLTFLGEFERANTHYERALALFDPERHTGLAGQWGQDLGIATHAMVAFNRAVRGQTRSALSVFATCEAYGAECTDVNSQAYLHMSATMLQMALRDDDALQRHAQALADLSAEYSLSYFGQYSNMVQGLLKVARGDPAGLEHYRAADTVCVQAKAICVVPMLRVETARRAFRHGWQDPAFDLASQAAEMIEATGERKFLADLHRLQAEFALEAGDLTEAQTALQRSMDVARAQTAKLLELRAVFDLAKVLRLQGRTDEIPALVDQAVAAVADGDCAREMARLSRFLS